MMLRHTSSRLLAAAAIVMITIAGTTPKAVAQPTPTQGPGGPILVITSPTCTYGTYYAEILRAEGLNYFSVMDVSAVTSTVLGGVDVAILCPAALSADQVSMFTTWVNGGGNLIAMKPDPQLASLLGLTAAGTTLSNAYLLVDTSKSPGNGIVAQTMQFHGAADKYSLITGTSAVATLYANATTATANPAITIRNVGTSGGHAAAFVWDLATSIVYMRQGNPAWAAQERDGTAPIRSDDKFFGAAAADIQPDWVDLTNLVSVPQADEQQRLLANLILQMNASRKPFPRFWYLPRGKKAVMLMTGDDHGNGGTAGRFDQQIAASTPGCNVANWECVRSTSYIYVELQSLTAAQAASYVANGFEVGLHINTNCADFTPTSLDTFYSQQVSGFKSAYPTIPAPFTERHHCIVWSDWLTGARTELKYGIRLDASYYFWPPSWVNNRPGHFTGSAMPMRFADLDGSLIDVYNVSTQMTDESGQTYPFTSDALLSAAVGPLGYYGVYTVNAHTDSATNAVNDAAVSSAQSRGVPIVSSAQLLTWLDGRNSSAFQNISWGTSGLSFTISAATGSNGLQAMLPVYARGGSLSSITGPSGTVAFSTDVIKGVTYAFFNAAAGSYTATYTADTVRPTVTSTAPANNATGVAQNTTVSATFSKAIDPASVNTSTFTLQSSAGSVPATVSYNPGTRSAVLTPASALRASTVYTATLTTGITDLSGNTLAANVVWSFTTASGPACPCSAWSSTATPANPSVNDPNAVELGVRFKVDLDGMIAGIRFYKGAANTGTHVGNLWSASGQNLGTATFAGETASGWQQVNFATPVPVTANTVYVASYHTNTGNYAGDNSFFATTGVDNPPIHLLQDGVSGADGVYAYGASSTFPSSTFQSTNYWVDVVYVTSSALTVVSTTPGNGTTGVSASSAISAVFSNSLNASTVTSATFTLTSSSGAVAGTYTVSGATATLTPSAPLAASTTYTATLTTGIRDVNGAALTSAFSWTFTTAAATTGCTGNPIVVENCLAGNPSSEWDISGEGDTTIQGFTTDISVNQGGIVTFKLNTPATSWRLDIYRMGFYSGNGARKVATVNGTGAQNQPACLTSTTTGLIDCGNWTASATWSVPANATSGIYFARAVRTDTGGASHIVFIVRNDASHSDLLFQTSDTTWEAYNNYGGNSLYLGGPGTNPARAYKVSYNRPFRTRAVEAETWLFNAEYPMVRWLEANGYDVSYTSSVDTERFSTLLTNHKVWMSNGHDEYWSAGQRASVQAARDAGVNLTFFSGNTMFWKTRWENSIDASNTAFRTIVCYKETHANAVIDPADPPTWTGTWRDPRFSPPADGGKPENAVVGTWFRMNGGQSGTITVPQADGLMRFWRNTSVATLPAGGIATLAPGTIGAEFDTDEDNGFRPAGLTELSSTSITDSTNYLLDYGSTYGAGTAVHKVTLYKAASGSKVFAAGTYNWAWGLDANHDRSNLGATTDVRMQQATVNLFADMGVQPATLKAGLTAATASADATPPVSTISSPTSGSTATVGTPVTISGSATDAGGVVASVEVSVDGGTTWHPATGRASWTYNWTPSSSGTITIKSRATDDSGNPETPGAGVSVTVSGAVSCTSACTLWAAATAPTVVDGGPDSPVELGVKFTADVSGSITGIRFYKASTNTGTHVGNLWSSTGQLLASATFSGESASGWQQVNFTTPVSIVANTVYVASYHVTTGHYSQDQNYFATAGVDRPPLHAVQNGGASGLNGVYAYGASSVFPSQSFNASNYWVDVVFTPGPAATLTSITVTPANPTILTGGTVQFTATGTYSDSSTQNLTNAVTWASATTTVATINSTGLASGVSAGTSSISAKQGTVSGSTILTVQTAPLSVTTTSLPGGSVGVPYSGTLNATGGKTPYSWAIVTGSLPTGLNLTSTSGAISGTPTAAGTFTFTAQVTDAAATKASSNSLSIVISTAPACSPNCTIWAATAVPTTADQGADSAVELGVKFKSDVNGSITGIRFYKASTNTGTHIAHLWTSAGTLLATATFSGETASGWQQVSFATPVAITANTVYVASYHCNIGHYSDDQNYFATAGVDRAPLHALANGGVSGVNGVFKYGASGVFPNQGFNSSNYWVDVVMK